VTSTLRSLLPVALVCASTWFASTARAEDSPPPPAPAPAAPSQPASPAPEPTSVPTPPQPGASPPGASPPGASPPGAYPPGAYPPGASPPGAYPPGAYPPGAYRASAYPSGAYPLGVTPPTEAEPPPPGTWAGAAQDSWGYAPAGAVPGAAPGGGWLAQAQPTGQPASSCCTWSVRYDPFDLLFRRITAQVEIGLGKLPFSIEATPKYIFDSPEDLLDEQGYVIGGSVGWYPGGKALRGLWVKAHAEYERFQATLSRDDGGGAIGKPGPGCDPDSKPGTCTRTVSSPILGVMIGATQIFGKRGGFAVSGGIGVGAALADATPLAVQPCTKDDVADGVASCPTAEGDGASGVSVTYYGDSQRVRLLGSLGIGVVF